MPRHLTPAPDPLPIHIQHKRHGNKRHRQESQQTARPPHPKARIHGIRKQRKRSPKRRPHQIIARIHRSDILRVRVAEVRQHRHEEQERADAEEGAADDGHDLMHGRARRPPEPEQADGDAEGADESRGEAVLGFEVAGGVEEGFHVLVDVPEEGRHDGEGAEEDAEEGEAGGARGEMVDGDEDEGEGFEPEVEESLDEGDVEVEEEDDGFGEGEGEGADEGHLDDFAAGHAFGFELWLAG